MTHIVSAGFIPLLDSVILVMAREKGFAEAEGIELDLVREISWANIRDRVAVGHFDVAHMLGPMPVAASLGLNPIATPVFAPMALGLGGNAVTVSTALWARMEAAGAPGDLAAGPVGAALATLVREGRERLRFGVVHPHSTHNYELRYWLAASGIDPDRDVEIVVLPPPLMADALGAGQVDGYCVGEPWNSAGVASGAGRIATVKANIWRLSPEKVLGVAQGFARERPEALAALLRALYRAARFVANPENHKEAAHILSRPDYLDRPAELMLRGLSGEIAVAPGEIRRVPDFFVPFDHSATFPWISHALWFYSQMVRWGDVAHSPDHARRAAAAYRPDLYRAAIAPLGPSLPTTDARPVEPDAFFDGRAFDPADIDGYLAGWTAS